MRRLIHFNNIFFIQFDVAEVLIRVNLKKMEKWCESRWKKVFRGQIVNIRDGERSLGLLHHFSSSILIFEIQSRSPIGQPALLTNGEQRKGTNAKRGQLLFKIRPIFTIANNQKVTPNKSHNS